MLFEWERVKEEIIAEVCEQCPDIPEDIVRKVTSAMSVKVQGLLIEASYRVLERRSEHV